MITCPTTTTNARPRTTTSNLNTASNGLRPTGRTYSRPFRTSQPPSATTYWDARSILVLPNGLNIQRFAVLHEFQNLHRQYKRQIHRFTMGHFFPSYHFDLDKTLYFFTSGRYESRNKGMDLTIEALARLNFHLQRTGSDKTVVAFIITRCPTRSINVTALESKAMLDELHTVAEAIQKQIGARLFESAASGKIPDLNSLVDEYWLLRLRRTMHTWKRELPPGIVTHDLVDDASDDLLNQLRGCRLWNQEHDRVKVIYHPDFITPTNPLFGLDYDQFVRGCHLGIFPSYYEPWGYTPLESIALGVPAVTSDLAGFGSYVSQMMHDHDEKGPVRTQASQPPVPRGRRRFSRSHVPLHATHPASAHHATQRRRELQYPLRLVQPRQDVPRSPQPSRGPGGVATKVEARISHISLLGMTT